MKKKSQGPFGRSNSTNLQIVQEDSKERNSLADSLNERESFGDSSMMFLGRAHKKGSENNPSVDFKRASTHQLNPNDYSPKKSFFGRRAPKNNSNKLVSPMTAIAKDNQLESEFSLVRQKSELLPREATYSQSQNLLAYRPNIRVVQCNWEKVVECQTGNSQSIASKRMSNRGRGQTNNTQQLKSHVSMYAAQLSQSSRSSKQQPEDEKQAKQHDQGSLMRMATPDNYVMNQSLLSSRSNIMSQSIDSLAKPTPPGLNASTMKFNITIEPMSETKEIERNEVERTFHLDPTYKETGQLTFQQSSDSLGPPLHSHSAAKPNENSGIDFLNPGITRSLVQAPLEDCLGSVLKAADSFEMQKEAGDQVEKELDLDEKRRSEVGSPEASPPSKPTHVEFVDIVLEVISVLNEESQKDLICQIKHSYLDRSEECLSLSALLLRYNEGIERIQHQIQHLSLLRDQQQCFLMDRSAYIKHYLGITQSQILQLLREVKILRDEIQLQIRQIKLAQVVCLVASGAVFMSQLLYLCLDIFTETELSLSDLVIANFGVIQIIFFFAVQGVFVLQQRRFMRIIQAHHLAEQMQLMSRNQLFFHYLSFLLSTTLIWPKGVLERRESSVAGAEHMIYFCQTAQFVASLLFIMAFAHQVGSKQHVLKLLLLFFISQGLYEFLHVIVHAAAQDTSAFLASVLIRTLKLFIVLTCKVYLLTRFGVQRQILINEQLFIQIQELFTRKSVDVLNKEEASPSQASSVHSPKFQKDSKQKFVDIFVENEEESEEIPSEELSKYRGFKEIDDFVFDQEEEQSRQQTNRNVKEDSNNSSKELHKGETIGQNWFRMQTVNPELQQTSNKNVFEHFLQCAMLFQVWERDLEVVNDRNFDVKSVRSLQNQNNLSHKELNIEVLKMSPKFFDRLPDVVSQVDCMSLSDHKLDNGHKSETLLRHLSGPITFQSKLLKMQEGKQEENRDKWQQRRKSFFERETRQVTFEHMQDKDFDNNQISNTLMDLPVGSLNKTIRKNDFEFTLRQRETLDKINTTQQVIENLEKLKPKLYDKIFEPYMITQSTSLLFENVVKKTKRKQGLYLSIIDIIEIFHNQFQFASEQKRQTKLYFKVDFNKIERKLRKTSNMHTSNHSFQVSKKKGSSSRKARPNDDEFSKGSLLNASAKGRRRFSSDQLTVEDQASAKNGENRITGIRKQPSKYVSNINLMTLPTFDGKKTETRKVDRSSQSISSCTSSSLQSEEEKEPCLSLHYKNFEEKKGEAKNDKVMYFEFDLNEISEEQGDYPLLDSEKKVLAFLNIKDISLLIRTFKKYNDKVYIEAIQSNFSHEQMTPLNCILNSSQLVEKKISRLLQDYNQLRQQHPRQSSKSQIQSISGLASSIDIDDEGFQAKTLSLIKSIEQSGMILQLYSQNQIKRMQIQVADEKLELNPKPTSRPEKFIREVMDPFRPAIESKNLSVFIARRNDFTGFKLKQDWEMYKLILFNIIQNAVKYNSAKGSIVILLTCLPIQKKKTNIIYDPDIGFSRQESPTAIGKMKQATLKSLTGFPGFQPPAQEDDFTHVLETEIIDTGVGIDKDRQKLLFVPFSELGRVESINKVKDFNIGMGLACSQIIVSALKGDIAIKQSQPKLTIFGFKLPVSLEESQGPSVTEPFGKMKLMKVIGDKSAQDLEPEVTAFCSKSQEVEVISEGGLTAASWLMGSRLLKKPKNNLRNIRRCSTQQTQVADLSKEPQRVRVNKMGVSNRQLLEPFPIQKAHLEERKTPPYQDNFYTIENSRPYSNMGLLGETSPISSKMDFHPNFGFPSSAMVGHSPGQLIKGQSLMSIQNTYSMTKLTQSKHTNRANNQCIELPENSVSSSSMRESTHRRTTIIHRNLPLKRNISLEDRIFDRFQGRDFAHLSHQEKLTLARHLVVNNHRNKMAREIQVQNREAAEDPALHLHELLRKESSKSFFQSIDQNNPTQVVPALRKTSEIRHTLGDSSVYDVDLRNLAKFTMLTESDADVIRRESTEPLVLIKSDQKAGKVFQETIGSKVNSLKKLPLGGSEVSLFPPKNSPMGQNSAISELSNFYHQNQCDIETLSDADLRSSLDNSSAAGNTLAMNMKFLAESNVFQQNINMQKVDKPLKREYVDYQTPDHLSQKDRVEQQRSFIANHLEETKEPSHQQRINFHPVNRSQFQIHPIDIDEQSFTPVTSPPVSLQFKSHKIAMAHVGHESIDSGDYMMMGSSRRESNDTSFTRMSPPIKRFAMGTIMEDQQRMIGCKNQQDLVHICNKQILVVDDTEFNLIPITTMIEDEFGFKPDTAMNGKISLEMFKSVSEQRLCSGCGYKLIIMDIQMPVMDGLEATRKILDYERQKTADGEHGVRIVGLSSYSNKQNEAIQSGMRELFSKPLTLRKLYEIFLRYYFRVNDHEVEERLRAKFGGSESEDGRASLF